MGIIAFLSNVKCLEQLWVHSEGSVSVSGYYYSLALDPEITVE